MSLRALEEADPMFVEKKTLVATFLDTATTQTDPTPSKVAPRRGFSGEQTQLIFHIRQDVVDQIFNQDISSHRLDVLFDSLSGEPVNRSCPTCC